MGRGRQRASCSTSQCADDPALRHAVHLPLTVGHPLMGQTEKNSLRAYVFRFAPRTRTLLDVVGMSQRPIGDIGLLAEMKEATN
jgi:hypothetical protein